MPRMSGRMLMERLRTSRPDVRVLFMSGYTDDEVLRRGIADRQTVFLQKPFTPEQLRARVREALESPAKKRRSPKRKRSA